MPWFRVPKINYSPKLLNGKFKKSVIHKLKAACCTELSSTMRSSPSSLSAQGPSTPSGAPLATCQSSPAATRGDGRNCCILLLVLWLLLYLIYKLILAKISVYTKKQYTHTVWREFGIISFSIQRDLEYTLYGYKELLYMLGLENSYFS